MAEHDPEQVGPPAFALDARRCGLAVRSRGYVVRSGHRGACAEIYLGLGAGLALHASERRRRCLRESPTETLDAVVAAVKAVLGLQILPDALTGQPPLQRRENGLPERLTQTRRPG